MPLLRVRTTRWSRAVASQGSSPPLEPARIHPGGRDSRLSVIIPVRNELDRLPAVLAGIECQLCLPGEVVVADGRSTDGSREWLEAARRSRSWLVVVDNPALSVPAGLNAALARSTGALVARMDAHADYAPDYLWELVRLLDARSNVVAAGGAMETVGCGPWGRAIAAVLRRRIGMGGSRHRINGAGGPTQHVFTACYRRSAVVAAGGYDERLRANEDFELDARLLKEGGIVWLHPAARCRWYVRESLPALGRQMWRYGYHKGLTLHLHPESLRPRQCVPPMMLIGLGALLAVDRRMAARAAAGYLVGSGAIGIAVARADGAAGWRGGAVPAVVHVSWGSGLLAGLLRFRRADSSIAPAVEPPGSQPSRKRSATKFGARWPAGRYTVAGRRVLALQ